MNFKYETQGTNTYVVYEIDKSEMMDSMTLGMITNNKISGLAQAFFFQQDSTKYVKYNISSKVSAEQFLMGTVNKKRLIGVFKGIVNALISAEEYMIDASSLCFDLDYIYADVTSCETVMLCLPVTDVEKPAVDLKAFFKNIVFSVQFDQTESGDYIAKLINYLNSASAFSLYDFKEVLDTIEHGAKPVEQPTSQVQQMPQQSVTQSVITQQVESQVQNQPVLQQKVSEEAQSVVKPITVQQNTMNRPTSVTQSTPQMQQATTMGTGFAIPGQEANKVVEKQNVPDSNALEQGSDEKEISWLYLLRHYDKDTAALYKAQQEAKKAAKAAGAPAKEEKKKDKKDKKEKGTKVPVPNMPCRPPVPAGMQGKPPAPNGMQNPGFAIPGQASQLAAQPLSSGDYAAPRATSVPQTSAPVTPQPTYQQPAQTAQPVYQAPQATPLQPANMAQQPTGMTANFGETTVLSSAGIGETTVLNASTVAVENNPYLTRAKNNERIMVDKPVFRIGKEKSFVDYFIADNTAISRSHANIITRDGEYFIQDTNSTNHTYVDGQMIQSNVEVKIAHGTKIKLANEDFEFKIY